MTSQQFKYLFNFLFVMLLHTISFNAYAQINLIGADSAVSQQTYKINVCIDTDNQITIDQLIHQSSSTCFHTFSQDMLKNIHGKTIWFKLLIPQSAQNTERWIQVLPAWLDSVTFYQVKNDGSYIKEENVHAQRNRFSYYQWPIFKYHTEIQNTSWVYIKIHSKMINGVGITEASTEQMLTNTINNQLFYGVVFGIFGVLILISLWFEKAIGDGIYGTFALYVFFYLLLRLALTGWLYRFFDDVIDLHQIPVISLSLLWVCYFCSLFFFKFIKYDLFPSHKPANYLRFLFWYSVIFSAAAFTPYEPWLIKIHLLLFQFVALPFSAWLIWRLIKRSSVGIKNVFVYAGMMLIISSSVSILSSLNLLPYNIYLLKAPIIASTIFFLLIFYGLSITYKKMRDDKEATTLKLLKLTQRTESELNKLVNIKTKDLQAAKEKIEQVLIRDRQMHQEHANFISMVSHEFRTPLTVIDIAAKNMEAKVEGDYFHQKLNRIIRSVERINSLLTEYLTKDRLNIFMSGLQPAWFNVLPILKRAEQFITSTSPLHVFMLSTHQTDTIIWGDENSIELVISTLVSNAIKYTPTGSILHIDFYTQDNGWVIDVIDNGPGIDPVEKELVFEKFYRGSASSNQIGSGLGLTLARNLIRIQGGDLTLENPQNVSGCCFRIRLPQPKKTHPES